MSQEDNPMVEEQPIIDKDQLVKHELEEQMRFRESMEEVIPKTFKSLRCCKICGLIKDEQQFLANGCENCVEDFGKEMKLFSAQFSGMLSLLRPDRSYIAQCLNMKNNYHVGLYAVSCNDMLDDEDRNKCTRLGIQPIVDRLI